MARRDPTKLNTSNFPYEAYDFLRKWFTLLSLFAGVLLLVINAPFGRFVPTGSQSSRHPLGFFNWQFLMVNGIRSWIVMELVAPITFTVAFAKSPLSFYKVALPDAFSPQGILAALFLIHYLNRALLSPLRTPSRSKAHLIIPAIGVLFNLANGFLIGSYLTSPFARMYLAGPSVFQRTSFRLGITLWAVGFVGNIVHDEILLDIRRKAQARKEKDAAEEKKSDKKKEHAVGEHYGIPTGLLYKYISYPNYFCEWIEWFGFALAASPLPIPLDLDAIAEAPTLVAAVKMVLETFQDTFVSLLFPSTWKAIIQVPNYAYAPLLTPPWIFLINEIFTMLPRAWKGHLWYKERFGDSYPKDRKAVIPFVF
ncbi:3-oxo-5-alpha-steroid 4-dehydrogenase 1 [Ephemerocybe angulata]|uniref:3-oxo-5-alpha-steroid 4-dehydrogenase 1 n=1 Tax=Ephemerocybe angulata TaxID=980116 RepID=A0A8H6LZI9_9AGAR|nr:3-oxo-5-alpha-steroid 4-dehydrogenase 1 [Tulosesus angulatus]